MYDKIINILKRDIEKNSTEYNELRYRKMLLKSISFEERLSKILGLSTIFYMVLFGLLVVVMQLSPFIFPLIIMGSVGGSALLDKFLLKKYNNRNRVKEFSNAHTYAEIEEEIVKYEFEMGKVYSKIVVSQEALSVIEDKNRMYSALSKEYKLSRRNNDSLSSELNHKMNDNYNILNKLSLKKVIQDKFYRLIDKGIRLQDTYKNSMLSALVFMILTAMPIMTGAFNPSIGLITLIASPLVGGLVPAIYLNIRDKSQMEILNKFNISVNDMNDFSQESFVSFVKEMGLDLSNLLECTELTVEESTVEEENQESCKVVNQEVYVSEETVSNDDVQKLGLNKKYPRF